MYAQEVTHNLFQRRNDLTLQKRILIAYIVLFQYKWGLITNLANKYNVSRQFIYDTVKQFSTHYINCYENRTEGVPNLNYLRYILSMRMEGKCSIFSISTLMQRFGLPCNSVGHISEVLSEIGRKIGNGVDLAASNKVLTVCICCDEIFSKQTPILITVDPKSLLILNIEICETRSKDAWVNHLQEIKKQGVVVTFFVSDEGLGVVSGMEEELPETVRQSDTFHAVAHRLGVYVNRLLNIAYKCIENQYRSYELFNKAKSEQTLVKRMKEAMEAEVQCKAAIEMYDSFNFLYHCLLECLLVFDKTGNLKDIQKVKGDFDTALDLIKELGNNDINKEIKSIEACKSTLFTFYQTASQITNSLSQTIDNKALKLLSLAWQFHKNIIKSKKKKDAIKIAA